MSDEIKTNDTVEEVVETEIPETEDVAEETVETLDNAEEVTEDVAEETSEDDGETKAKPKKHPVYKINPKTGKKRLRGWLVALITIVTIIAVCTSAFFITLKVLADNLSDSTIGDAPEKFGLSFENGNDVYTDYSDHFEQFKDEIEAGMAEDATDEEKVLAAWIIYRIASMADYNAPEKAKYTTGGGTATGELTLAGNVHTVSGGLNMTSTYYTILDAQSKKYVAQEEFTQVPANSVTASSDFLQEEASSHPTSQSHGMASTNQQSSPKQVSQANLKTRKTNLQFSPQQKQQKKQLSMNVFTMKLGAMNMVLQLPTFQSTSSILAQSLQIQLSSKKKQASTLEVQKETHLTFTQHGMQNNSTLQTQDLTSSMHLVVTASDMQNSKST